MVSYASVLGSMMSAKMFTRLNICFAVGLVRCCIVILDILIGKRSRGFFVIYVERQITCSIIKDETHVCVAIWMPIGKVI